MPRLPRPPHAANSASLHARLTPGSDALAVYGSLTGKTVLMASGLPRLPDSIIAGLVGKTAVPEPKFEGARIWLHISTPLSKSDLLYAIETTFALNGFAIIPVDAHSIRLGRLSSISE